MSRRALAFVLSAFALAACGPKGMTDLGPAPTFELPDQNGARFSAESLRGHVWIGSFIYTSCRDICPMLTTQLRNVQRRLATGQQHVDFVTFTTDPETDTPDRLLAYGREHDVDFGNWHFLAGDSSAQQRQMAAAYYRWADETPPADLATADLANSLHATHLMLVDGSGRIRGFYRYDADGLDELVAAVRTLLH